MSSGVERNVPPSVDELLEMAAMARRHYLDGVTRVDIAEEFGVSRFRVARLLELARKHGVVRIDVALPGRIEAEISRQLRDRFGLMRAIVVRPADSGGSAVIDAIGRAAAQLMTDVVTQNDVVGVTSGRTIDAMVRHLVSLPACEVVQLTGVSGDLTLNSVETVRRLSRGRTHMFYAPLVLDSPTTAAALRNEPAVSRTTAGFGRVTVAFVAVGSWSPPESRFYDALDPQLREQLVHDGVQADIAGALIDGAGNSVTALQDRTIGIFLEQLRRIPNVVVVAGGVRKARALRAALMSGAVNNLVTDIGAAEALLARANPGKD